MPWSRSSGPDQSWRTICVRSEEHTSELQSHSDLVCRLLLEKKKQLARKRDAYEGERVDNRDRECEEACELLHQSPGGLLVMVASFYFFFFNDTATTEIYTLSLHDALPISTADHLLIGRRSARADDHAAKTDRKSTRLNSSHTVISYAVFCLKKKKTKS